MDGAGGGVTESPLRPVSLTVSRLQEGREPSSGYDAGRQAATAREGTPLRLLPVPSDSMRIPHGSHELGEGNGIGIAFALPERGGLEAGPVVSQVFPGGAADKDGTVRVGDRLESVDGESVRSWSMAKIRRVIGSKAGGQVALEIDRGGRKIAAVLTPLLVQIAADAQRVMEGSAMSAVEIGSPEARGSRLSLSALAQNGSDEPTVSRREAPTVSRLSTLLAGEQLQVRLKELSAAKADLELKVSDLLLREKAAVAKSASNDKELQRSNAQVAMLSKELQEMNQKCMSLEQDNAELCRVLEATKRSKDDIVERARRDADTLLHSERSLRDARELAQQTVKALEDEKRAHLRKVQEAEHTMELLTFEKERREEFEIRLQRAEDQATASAAHARTSEDLVKVLEDNLRLRDLEGVDLSQREEKSRLQAFELHETVGRLRNDLSLLTQEKSNWLQERQELRRAVLDLEYAVKAGTESLQSTCESIGKDGTAGHNPDKTASPTSFQDVNLLQRILGVTDFMKKVNPMHGLKGRHTLSNEGFQHQTQHFGSLVASLASDLSTFSGEIQDILRDSDRIQSSYYAQTCHDSMRIASLEQRCSEQETMMIESHKTVTMLTMARDEALVSVERHKQSQSWIEESSRVAQKRSVELQASLEKEQERIRSVESDSDSLRCTIRDLESQYKELQARSKHFADTSAVELRNALEKNVQLESEISDVRAVHVAAISDAKNKEAARTVAMKERDEAKRSLEDTEAQVQNLDNKLQSVQRERDALLAEVEEQKITHSLSIVALEQNNSSLRNELNELQGLQKFCGDLQTKYSDSKKQAAAQQSEISDLRRLLTSSEIEVESLKTSYGNVSSGLESASREVERLNQQYRDCKQEEATLITQLAECGLHRDAVSSELTNQSSLAESLSVMLRQSREKHASDLAAAATQASEVQKQVSQLLREANEMKEVIDQQLALSEDDLQSFYIGLSHVKAQKHALEEENMILKDNLKASTQVSTELGERNKDLEGELDQMLSTLHTSQTQHKQALEEICDKDMQIASLKDHAQAVEFQRACVAQELEGSHQKLEQESTARNDAADIIAQQAQEISDLKDTVAKVGEEARTRIASLEEAWLSKHAATEQKLQDRNQALEGSLKETTDAMQSAERQFREEQEKCNALAQSSHEMEKALQNGREEAFASSQLIKELREALGDSKSLAMESQQGLESSLEKTKALFETEKAQHQQTITELNSVSAQRERLRKEFMDLSSKYKALINESDRLANALDSESQNKLAQTVRAGTAISRTMEDVRNEFEDDMLQMALDLKDLMHHQNLESPGSDNMNASPERGSLYKSVAASNFDPRDEIKAIATLGIAKDRIKDLEECVAEKQNELEQNKPRLEHAQMQQAQAESDLLSSRQRQARLEEEVEALKVTQQKLDAETVTLRADYQETKHLLESRDEELEIQKQAVADLMDELTAEQLLVMSASQRDKIVSEELKSLRINYHDAIEAQKLSETRLTKKALEAESTLADCAARCTALQSQKNQEQATLKEQLNDANKAKEDAIHSYELCKVAWDEYREDMHRRLADASEEKQNMQAQIEEATLTHATLTAQIAAQEAEIASEKIKNGQVTCLNKRLTDQATADSEMMDALRHDVDRSETQILELEETLEKVLERCRHYSQSMIELQQEVSRLTKSADDRDLNLEKMTSSYQDLAKRFDLSLKREMEAAAKIRDLELDLREKSKLSEMLHLKLEASDARVTAGVSANSELQEVLSQHTHSLAPFAAELETTQVQLKKVAGKVAKKFADFDSMTLDLKSAKKALQVKLSEIQSLNLQVENDDQRIQALEAEIGAMQGILSTNSAQIGTLEESSLSLQDMLLQHQRDALRLQTELQESNYRLAQSESELQQCEHKLTRAAEELETAGKENSKLHQDLVLSRSEVESNYLIWQRDQEKLSQMSDDKQALQEYKDLLEEQVRSLNGFVILHEKEKEHLHREVDELRLARDSDRELIDSLRLELSNLGGLSLRCHEQAQDSEKISYSLDCVAAEIEHLAELLGSIISAASWHSDHSHMVLNEFERRLKVFQPMMDELTYCTVSKLSHQIELSGKIEHENQSLRRENHVLRGGGQGQERLLIALREQITDLHASCLQHATEKGQLTENLSALELKRQDSEEENLNLRGRLASVEQSLDQFQKSMFALQSQNTEQVRENQQVSLSLDEIQEALDGLDQTLTTTCGAFESHQSSFAGTCDFVEKIVEDISQLIGVESNFFLPSTPVRPSRRRPSLARKTEDAYERPYPPRVPRVQRRSLASETGRIVNDSAIFRVQVKDLRLANAVMQERFREEQEGRRRSEIALAESTHVVNQLQACVHEMQDDLMVQKTLITFSEEQHFSLHEVLNANQDSLREKEAQIQITTRKLADAQSMSNEMTGMLAGIEDEVSLVRNILESAALQSNEIASLREDRNRLEVVQNALAQSEAKNFVFNQVLNTLQENHRTLEAEHTETIRLLENQANEADDLKDTVERQGAEIMFIAKRAEEQRRQSMSRIIRRMQNGLNASAFAYWCENAKELSTRRGKVKQIICRWRNQVCNVCFQGWLHILTEGQEKTAQNKAVVKKMVTRMLNSILCGAWECWRLRVDEAVVEREEEQRRQRIMHNVFRRITNRLLYDAWERWCDLEDASSTGCEDGKKGQHAEEQRMQNFESMNAVQHALQEVHADMQDEKTYISSLEDQRRSLHASLDEKTLQQAAIEKQWHEEKSELLEQILSLQSKLKKENDEETAILEELVAKNELVDILEKQIAVVESSMASALTDSRRVRHELLKSMADNVDLRQQLEHFTTDSITLGHDGGSVLQKTVEDLKKDASEQNAIVSILTGELTEARKQTERAESYALSVARDKELQSIVIETLEEQVPETFRTIDQVIRHALSLIAELDSCKAANVVLTMRVTEDNATHESNAVALRQLQANQKLLPILEGQLETLHSNLVQSEMANHKLASEIANLENVNSTQLVELSELRSRLNECTAPLSMLLGCRPDAETPSRLVQLASDKIASLEASLLQSDKDMMAMRSHVEQDKMLLGEWNGKVHGFDSERVSASQIIGFLNQQVGELQQRIAVQVAEKEALDARLKNLQQVNADGQAQLSTIQQGIVSDRRQITALQKQTSELQQQIVADAEIADSQRRLISLLEAEAKAREDDLQTLRVQLDSDAQGATKVGLAMECLLQELDNNVLAVLHRLHYAVEDLEGDKHMLEGMVTRFKREYAEEQSLSSMLQSQVQTLHASLVTLKDGTGVHQ